MGNDATGLFDIVLVGADSRLELADVVPHVARLSGLPAETIGPRIAAGVPFFVGRNLDRGTTRTQLEAYRAVGARVKPWQAGVPLPAHEVVTPIAATAGSSSRVSGPAPRGALFASDDPFATPPPPTRTRMPSLTELDAPLEPVSASASFPAMPRPAMPAVPSSARPPSVGTSARPPSVAGSARMPTTPGAGSAGRTASSMRLPAVSDRGGRG